MVHFAHELTRQGIPQELYEAWLLTKDAIVQHNGATIDFHGGDTSYKPKHLSRQLLSRVTDSFLLSTLSNRLTSLNVTSCAQLSDDALMAIADDCHTLRKLRLGYCPHITNLSIMAVAKGCPLLIELHVTGCKRLTNDSIQAIAESCPSLAVLNVASCEHLTDAPISAIGARCHSLLELNVAHCEQLTDKSIKAIANGCPSLTGLDVELCKKVTNASILAIASRCPHLTKLDVRACKYLTDESIEAIATGCHALAMLDVSACMKLTDASINAIAAGCHSLTELYVEHCMSLTDGSINQIAATCASLVELSVYHCDNLTDASIKAIAAGCPVLTKLNVSKCGKLTDDSIRAIAAHCPALKELNVAYCELLSDNSIMAIADACTSLVKLRVSGCEHLTDISMTHLAARCRLLATLWVQGCSNLTDESIRAIAAGCPSLATLWVKDCINLTDDSIAAIVAGCPSLVMLFASNCRFMSLPDDIGDRLPKLESLEVSCNELTSLPRSIVKLKQLRLYADQNPLQSPPIEIAERGIDAISRYFEELDKGSNISKLLKVVLVGDAEAGKTSIRNALAGRPKPRPAQDERTIHIDIEKISLEDHLDINIYDCGGQQGYLASQLPYLTGVALYLLVVEARYTAEEYIERKVHRFLDVLQNRVPGAVILPIVSKVDTVTDADERCRWLATKIRDWLHKTSTAATKYGQHITPLRLANAPDAALAISVDDSEREDAVRLSVQAVSDTIIALTKLKVPLLRGVGQEIPSTYTAVLGLFGAIAEYGDDERALQALRDGTARGLGEPAPVSPNGTYRPRSVLESLWNQYREHAHVAIADDVFDNAIQLWEAQGLIFVDAGLVFLQPEFIATIVKPLVDHGLKMEVESRAIESAIFDFLTDVSEPRRAGDLYGELQTFVRSGEITSSLLLSFLWRHITQIESTHYRRILEMLAASGVISPLEFDGVGGIVIAVAPFRLAKEPVAQELAMHWPDTLKPNQRQYVLKFTLFSGCPAGLSERFASETHNFGTTLCAWIDGAVVKDITDRVILAKRAEANVLCFAVRFPDKHHLAAWKALCKAQDMLESQRQRGFVGLMFATTLCCGNCSQGESKWDPHTTEVICTKCGHSYQLCPPADDGHTNGASDEAAFHAQLVEKLGTMEATFLEKFNTVISMVDRNFVALEGLAREEHTYPTLFIIEPVEKEQWTWYDYLTFPFDIIHRKLRIVFICAESLEPVPYDGARGLEFHVVKRGFAPIVRQGHEFCEKYGLAIKIAAGLLTIATKQMLGVSVDASKPTAISDAVKKLNFVRYYEYAKKIGRLIDSGLTSSATDAQRADLQRETVTSYRAFGEFLHHAGFVPEKLPMSVKRRSDGHFVWVHTPPLSGEVCENVNVENPEKNPVLSTQPRPCCAIQ